MEKIELYDIISDSPTATSSAVYWKAKKNNEYFFLKRLSSCSLLLNIPIQLINICISPHQKHSNSNAEYDGQEI